jgi:hypothetical protein
MLPPGALDGPTLTNRKFGDRYKLDEPVIRGSVERTSPR